MLGPHVHASDHLHTHIMLLMPQGWDVGHTNVPTATWEHQTHSTIERPNPNGSACIVNGHYEAPAPEANASDMELAE